MSFFISNSDIWRGINAKIGIVWIYIKTKSGKAFARFGAVLFFYIVSYCDALGGLCGVIVEFIAVIIVFYISAPLAIR